MSSGILSIWLSGLFRLLSIESATTALSSTGKDIASSINSLAFKMLYLFSKFRY